jgi:hypothetical protein
MIASYGPGLPAGPHRIRDHAQEGSFMRVKFIGNLSNHLCNRIGYAYGCTCRVE